MATKTKPTASQFVCAECGYITPKWLGKCPACGSFNTMQEELVKREPAQKAARPALSDIARAASINHSTLTQLFKRELNKTPIEYLFHYRIIVAKKFLEFTELPIGEIALRCGFKTTQHFSRKFEEKMGCNPTAFRADVVENRKKTF